MGLNLKLKVFFLKNALSERRVEQSGKIQTSHKRGSGVSCAPSRRRSSAVGGFRHLSGKNSHFNTILITFPVF